MLNAHVHVQRLLEQHFDRFCGNYVAFRVFNVLLGCIFGLDGYLLIIDAPTTFFQRILLASSIYITTSQYVVFLKTFQLFWLNWWKTPKQSIIADCA